MSDLIDRQAAINTLNDEFTITGKTNVIVVQDYIRRVNNRLHDLPSVQPNEASCWGCNCQKMERLKRQKTFSEMVHLHDSETHDKRTGTHACDLISRQAAIDDIKSRDPSKIWDIVDIEEWVNALPSAQPISENDLIELQDRYGDEVRFVVEDMLSGEGKRWTTL